MISRRSVSRPVVTPPVYFRLMVDRRPELHTLDLEDLSESVPGALLRRKSIEIQSAFPTRVFLAKILGVHNEERAWRRGAAGEEEVARQLDKLGPSWRVLHSVPVSSNETDIDHVVIGPPGVFTLNTKNHVGKRVTVYNNTIFVSGIKLSYLNKSRAEGRRGSRILSSACGFEVTVNPVIVILASELVFKGSPKEVNVVGHSKIAGWLDRRSVQLSSDRIESIYSTARRRSTWMS